MSEELGKYREVFDMKRVNELYDLGYSLKETVTETYTNENGSIVTKKSLIMSLQEPSKYDDIGAFKKTPITDEWTPIEPGVRVIHNTSKEMILVKDRNPEEWIHVNDIPDWCASNEYIHTDEAYEYVCDNPPTRGA